LVSARLGKAAGGASGVLLHGEIKRSNFLHGDDRGGEARVEYMCRVTAEQIGECLGRTVDYKSRLHADESNL